MTAIATTPMIHPQIFFICSLYYHVTKMGALTSVENPTRIVAVLIVSKSANLFRRSLHEEGDGTFAEIYGAWAWSDDCCIERISRRQNERFVMGRWIRRQ